MLFIGVADVSLLLAEVIITLTTLESCPITLNTQTPFNSCQQLPVPHQRLSNEIYATNQQKERLNSSDGSELNNLRYLSQPITSHQISHSRRKQTFHDYFHSSKMVKFIPDLHLQEHDCGTTQVNKRPLTGQPASEVNYASIFGREMDRRCCWVRNTLVR